MKSRTTKGTEEEKTELQCCVCQNWIDIKKWKTEEPVKGRIYFYCPKCNKVQS